MQGRDGSDAALDWGAATFTLPGETESGDLHVVLLFAGGALIGVVDALGHGSEAAASARIAVAVLEQDPSAPVSELLRRCHSALNGKRGVVMSLAAFDWAAGVLTWAGVGNVEGYVFAGSGAGRPARTTLIAPGGIVGSALPLVRPTKVDLAAGDLLVFLTDGIRGHFVDRLPREEPPQQLAESIMSRCGKGTDDALVLVARYLGLPR
ncbi:MAG: SpoIIE family protein phosphatase [Gemmatimonadales bacterium]